MSSRTTGSFYSEWMEYTIVQMKGHAYSKDDENACITIAWLYKHACLFLKWAMWPMGHLLHVKDHSILKYDENMIFNFFFF